MKSFILSFSITVFICIFFMSLFEKNALSFLNQLPIELSVIIAIIFFAGYLLAMYWGITGIIKGQRLFNLLGIFFSFIGLAIYLYGFVINGGSGKEKPGQFDHQITQIESSQQLQLAALLQQTNTKTTDIKFVPYWKMKSNPDSFVICVQKGNIIGLQVKNKPVNNINTINKFIHLNWLIIENCNLQSIAGLQLPFLQRLNIDHNQLVNLQGLENEPTLSWISFIDNPVTDSAALLNHPNKGLIIIN